MGYTIPHIWKRAIKILEKNISYLNNDKRQAVVWKFTKSKDYPEGIKYRFAFIHKGKCVLRYDNERIKGHHKHIFDKEIKIKFSNVDKLYEQFKKEVKQLRKSLMERENES